MMAQRCLAALAVLFLMFSGSTVQAQSNYLDEPALRALFPGKYEARMGSRHKVLISASPSGEISGRLARGWYDTGRWWIADDRLCISWSVWTSGKPVCGRVQQDGEWYTASAPGEKDLKFRRLLTRIVYKNNVVRAGLGPIY